MNEVNDQSNEWYYQSKIAPKGKGEEFKISLRMGYKWNETQST